MQTQPEVIINKNPCTSRKLLYFVNWQSARYLKFEFSKSIFYVKKSSTFYINFLLPNKFLLMAFFLLQEKVSGGGRRQKVIQQWMGCSLIRYLRVRNFLNRDLRARIWLSLWQHFVSASLLETGVNYSLVLSTCIFHGFFK